MKAASRFTADRVSAKRSNIAAPSRQAHCRAAAGAYATNGFSFGGAGNPLACGPRAEHPQPEVHGAQIIHFLLQIRRGQRMRSEEHTSELQSQSNLVCRLLLEKKKKHTYTSSLSTQNPTNSFYQDPFLISRERPPSESRYSVVDLYASQNGLCQCATLIALPSR